MPTKLEIDLSSTPHVILSAGPERQIEMSLSNGLAATPEALKFFEPNTALWPIVDVEHPGTGVVTIEYPEARSSTASRPSPPVTKDDGP